MNLERIFGVLVNFFSNHLLITIIVIIVVSLLAYKKPRQTLKFIAITLFFLAVIYFGTYLQKAFFTGVEFKGDIIEKQESY